MPRIRVPEVKDISVSGLKRIGAAEVRSPSCGSPELAPVRRRIPTRQTGRCPRSTRRPWTSWPAARR